jgi:hypothetical protein
MGNKKFKLGTVEALALAIKVYNGNGNRIERDRVHRVSSSFVS